MNRKRNYKEIRNDSKVHLAGLAELPPDKAALERFRSPAYLTGTAVEHVARKYKIGGDAVGQTETETVPGITERAGTE